MSTLIELISAYGVASDARDYAKAKDLYAQIVVRTNALDRLAVEGVANRGELRAVLDGAE